MPRQCQLVNFVLIYSDTRFFIFAKYTLLFNESKERLNKIYSKHTGKTIEEISAAFERDNFMTAEDAKKFGLIDSVVEKRK